MAVPTEPAFYMLTCSDSEHHCVTSYRSLLDPSALHRGGCHGNTQARLATDTPGRAQGVGRTKLTVPLGSALQDGK